LLRPRLAISRGVTMMSRDGAVSSWRLPTILPDGSVTRRAAPELRREARKCRRARKSLEVTRRDAGERVIGCARREHQVGATSGGGVVTIASVTFTSDNCTASVRGYSLRREKSAAQCAQGLRLELERPRRRTMASRISAERAEHARVPPELSRIQSHHPRILARVESESSRLRLQRLQKNAVEESPRHVEPRRARMIDDDRCILVRPGRNPTCGDSGAAVLNPTRRARCENPTRKSAGRQTVPAELAAPMPAPTEGRMGLRRART